MPEEVTYDSENNVIYVRSWGECSIQDWEPSKAEVLRLSSELGCNRLLVDVREQESAPKALEIFEFDQAGPVQLVLYFWWDWRRWRIKPCLKPWRSIEESQ